MSYETKLSCPINRAVAALADKWKILIIIALQYRTWRFNELLHALEGIAPKVMVRQLRSLESDGLVVRTVHAEVPPRVEYALTEAGRTLVPILNELQHWVIENAAQLSSTITGINPADFGDVGGPTPPGGMPFETRRARTAQIARGSTNAPIVGNGTHRTIPAAASSTANAMSGRSFESRLTDLFILRTT